MWCTPTSIAPEAVTVPPGTGCLARSTVRLSVSLIIKSLLLPAAEHAHLVSLLAEGKDSHICMTRSFGRMTEHNFINKITLKIYMVKKNLELKKNSTLLSTNTQISSFSCLSLDLGFKNMLNCGELFQTLLNENAVCGTELQLSS